MHRVQSLTRTSIVTTRGPVPTLPSMSWINTVLPRFDSLCLPPPTKRARDPKLWYSTRSTSQGQIPQNWTSRGHKLAVVEVSYEVRRTRVPRIREVDGEGSPVLTSRFRATLIRCKLLRGTVLVQYEYCTVVLYARREYSVRRYESTYCTLVQYTTTVFSYSTLLLYCTQCGPIRPCGVNPL